jgi:predicted enzyme related to lactoylglutathione lyase
MHRSKLAGFIIDCQTQDLGSAAKFWSGALGMKQQTLPAEEGEKYIGLIDQEQRLHIEVQKVNHPSRVHLDVETDDIDAEVRRLTALGAKEIQRVHTWCVMEAPTGQRFCVVRAASKDFTRLANEWP